MTKIEVLEPICNASGVIYYAGFVNSEYAHFLGYDKLSKREIKENLLSAYERLYNIKVLGG